MTQIVLDEKQAAALIASRGQVRLCDAVGKVLGIAHPVFSPEEVDEATRRASSPGIWHTTDEALKRLRSIDAK